MSADAGLLSDRENQRVIMAMLVHRGERGASQEDLQKALDWAMETRIGQSQLECVLAGAVWIDTNAEGELLFGVMPGVFE